MDKPVDSQSIANATLSDAEPEIEVTPAMIEAGVAALYDYDSRFEPIDNVAENVFRAMWAVRAGCAGEEKSHSP